MLIAVASDKGSPGTTTTALALASAWTSPTTVVEADPYGGDLAVRLRTEHGGALPETPTVLTLATAARTDRPEGLLAGYAQLLNDVVSVVPGHLVAEQAAGLTDWHPLGEALLRQPGTTFVDLGRLHAGSPVLSVAALADVVLVVARADAASVIRLRERLARLVPALASRRTTRVRVWPVIVGEAKHAQRDIADVTHLLEQTAVAPLVFGLGAIAWDPNAVAKLEAGESPHSFLGRTALMRSARRIAMELSATDLNEVVA